jgi:DNA-binding response OmpR family regulator
LAVDDDATSLRALAMVLKKDFGQPDVAAEGEAALKLAGERLYDVIFLDIEMPGLDGFEVCEKIHETILNKATPVVFVSRHSDFNSRSKSVLSGGVDLIAKPFLSSEVRLKALALICRSRLAQVTAGDVSVPEAGNESDLAVKA